jgi:hypothetical protein
MRLTGPGVTEEHDRFGGVRVLSGGQMSHVSLDRPLGV